MVKVCGAGNAGRRPAQGSAAVNCALTAESPSSVTTQSSAPVQAPFQPVKVKPEAAVAARPTLLPSWKEAEQVPGQVMPAGVETTAPPVAAVTVSLCRMAVGVTVLKLA